MSVAFSSATVVEFTGHSAGTGNSSFAKPTGVSAGDLLVLYYVIAGAAGSSAAPPVGFTAVPLTAGSLPQAGGPDSESQYWWLYAWYKIAEGSEPGSYSVPFTIGSGPTTYVSGILAQYGGTDQITPITAAASDYGTGGTTTFNSVTSGADQSLIAVFQADDWDTSNSYTPPTGSTPTFATDVNTVQMFEGSGVLSPPGATGTKTMANNSETGTGWLSIMLAIQPPTTGNGFFSII